MALLNHLRAQSGTLIGTGIGTTTTLRAALTHPDRLAPLVPISVEEIEDAAAKAAEIELLDAVADRVRSHGLQAACEPLLQVLAPFIGTLVLEAIPRADPASIAATAAIDHDRSFAASMNWQRLRCADFDHSRHGCAPNTASVWRG